MKPSEMTTVEFLEATARGHENLCQLNLIPAQHQEEAREIAANLRTIGARLRGLLASVHGSWDLSDENIQRGLLLKRINEPSRRERS